MPLCKVGRRKHGGWHPQTIKQGKRAFLSATTLLHLLRHRHRPPPGNRGVKLLDIETQEDGWVCMRHTRPSQRATIAIIRSHDAAHPKSRGPV